MVILTPIPPPPPQPPKKEKRVGGGEVRTNSTPLDLPLETAYRSFVSMGTSRDCVVIPTRYYNSNSW